MRSFQNGGKVVQPAHRHLGEAGRTATPASARKRPNGTRSRSSTKAWPTSPSSYLRKGSKVYLEGQLRTRKWQDQSGNDRYSTEVVLQGFNGALVLLDSREARAAAVDAVRSAATLAATISAAAAAPARTQSRPQPAAFDTDLDDDVPF